MNGNIIICGAPRSGTTSLYRYLADHPEIVSSRRKELNFFVGGGNESDTYYERNEGNGVYYKQFGDVAGRIWSLEASPIYMHPAIARKVASRIAAVLPEVRLIFVLRDPIERLFSQYSSKIFKNGLFQEEEVSFDQYVMHCLEPDEKALRERWDASVRWMEGLKLACYAATLQVYLEYFQPFQMKVIFFEEMAANPQSLVMEIAEWLHVDASFYQTYIFLRENKSIVPRNKRLYDFALMINRHLEPFLNRYPGIRVKFRALHDRLNVRKELRGSQPLGESLRRGVNLYFKDPNARLRQLMSEKWGRTEFPSWLMHD